MTPRRGAPGDQHGEDRPLSDALASTVAAMPGTVYRRDADGDQPIAAATDGIESLTGYGADALDGDERGWLDLVHPDDRAGLRATIEDATPGEEAEATYRIQCEGGEERWVTDRLTIADDGATIDGIVLDATEGIAHDRADAELLADILEAVPVHIYVKDTAGRHRKVSDFLERSDELIGKRDADLEFVDDEHGRRATETDMQVIETGEPVIDEEEYLPKIDHWNLTSKVPIRDADGEVTGLIGVTRRITERKRAQQELHRKTERLEEFADIVSHDIQNPLSVAMGYAELARDADDREEYLIEVADALGRADDIVDDVLALSRRELALDLEPVSMCGVAQSAWRSVATGTATLSLPDEDREILADRSQLSRLLENLFKNAVEHGTASSSQPPARKSAPARDDGPLIAVELLPTGVAVVDDGPGIPAEKREQIFETAYTTSESGAGLGLGIVEEVVDAHGWSISVGGGQPGDGSEEYGGARFEITGVEEPNTDTTDQTATEERE
ncbi:PAS domain S-box-containing protein [Natronoarchaeum philippinense]|uniref:histidine kinase n=1 Tax=Natronoarchaeum philippinense TaxID=558529 RepID=A0A285PA86_NATPI|nr:ATP-binding protein [Natronoarchaeum philippinense]SNZ18123.1 PAS domain S-box-containing protein [Natronoarchaeum philippinense]